MWLSCVDPPESGLQERVCGVQPRGVHVSDTRQEALHLVFIPEDITKKTNTYSQKNFDADGLVYLTGSEESEQTRAASRVTRTDSIVRMTMMTSF